MSTEQPTGIATGRDDEHHSVANAKAITREASTPRAPAHIGPDWLHFAFRNPGDAVITIDAAGRVTSLNPVAQLLTGWEEQEAVNRPVDQIFCIVNEQTRAPLENLALRALRDGVAQRLAESTLLISRDGTERPIGPVDHSAAPFRDDLGNVDGVVLVFRDLTEHRRQESLISEALHFAENILATQREPFLVLDKSLRVVSANVAFYKSFGLARDATEGHFIYELSEGQWNVRRLRELLEVILPQDLAFEGLEVEHVNPDGAGKRTLVLNARRVRKPGEHSELILLAIEDITQRRAAETAIRESEIRYRRLFQTAKDGILILDAHSGKIIDANAFMSALVGLEPEDLMGKELFEIGMYKDIEENKEAFRELQRARYLRQDHLPVQNRNGERVEVEFIANVYDEGERLVAQCNVRDIRQRVELERVIKQQSEDLAGESRRKDEFLAMLSHELRNPLAPIRAAVYLLKTQEHAGENPVQQQAREIIERQVGHLTKLIGDLLEVSRVVSGRIRLDLQTLNLNQIVQHAAESVKSLLNQHRHTLTLHLCHDGPGGGVWVHADATRLEEVFINVLVNAIKYTPDGGTIAVHCEHPRDATHARMRIIDNGVGIDKELLPRIFDLFTQADHSLSRSQGGLGIGLSLAHRLVKLHGGDIVAHSPPEGADRGSEFVVTLRLVPPPRSAEPLTPADDEAPLDGGIRVLVIDDNIDLVTMVAGTLKHKGYRVQTAYDGLEGLKLARQWRADVVLLDIGLPGLDGYEVARRLRSAPTSGHNGKPMRLIALTGYGRDSDIALAKESGFDAHMTKPADIDELLRLIGTPHSKAP